MSRPSHCYNMGRGTKSEYNFDFLYMFIVYYYIYCMYGMNSSEKKTSDY